MDTISKNAVKKLHQCKNCAAASSQTPVTIASANPPATIAQNTSDTATAIKKKFVVVNFVILSTFIKIVEVSMYQIWSVSIQIHVLKLGD